MAHSAVQENDIEKLAFDWYSFLPFHFVLDKQNYLAKKRVSLQGQDRYRLRTSVDQRGEQTINKEAKTADLFISKFY